MPGASPGSPVWVLGLEAQVSPAVQILPLPTDPSFSPLPSLSESWVTTPSSCTTCVFFLLLLCLEVMLIAAYTLRIAVLFWWVYPFTIMGF